MATPESAGKLLDDDHAVVLGDLTPTCSLCGFGIVPTGATPAHLPEANDVDEIPGWIASYGGGRFG